MRCYECGYQNNEDVKVCIKCGTKLEAQTAPPSPPPVQNTPSETPPISGGAKTIRGKAADAPSWDASVSPTASSIIKCPSCQYYPLHEAPSTSSPCPNCGFGATEDAAPSSASKTVRVSAINLDGEPEKTSFKLVDESNGKEWDFDGASTDVNRDAIDSNNNSISSDIHATFSFEGGQLYIEDKSSNGATFIKVEGKMPISNGNKVVLGNRVFTIKID